jgi:hypothetical protein
MHRQFPQPFTNLYRDPIFPVNVRYSHKNHGGGVVRTFPRNHADQAGTTQYVVLYYYICLVCDLALEKFAKKLLGESEIEDVLHRIDRLTLDEARMTGTETLQVVHGLVSNLKLVIGSTQLSLYQLLITHRAIRIDGTTSMHDVWQALGMLYK